MTIPGSRRIHVLTLLVFAAFAARAGLAVGPETWVPARWQGGPLELQRRAENKTLPSDPAVRESIAKWYDPATLDLLKDTPINCLLVTWGTGADAETDKRQLSLVKSQAGEAHTRGLSVLGLIPAGENSSSVTELTAEAGLDGLVVEGDSSDIIRFMPEVRREQGNRPQYGDNTILLGEAAGIGSADLDKIDVRGMPIKDAVFDFEAHRTPWPPEAN